VTVLPCHLCSRFDRINAEFQQLMKDMAKEPNVVKATNGEGLTEQLEVLQGQLSLCEKALAEYLETKRLAFPRFYFASSADLLDILSNSDYPQKVAKHLTKLFDSMAKLTMEKEGSKLAISMTAKVNYTSLTLPLPQDGEVVAFSEPCVCKDQVEVWLNR
jgi:dynein heavy chain